MAGGTGQSCPAASETVSTENTNQATANCVAQRNSRLDVASGEVLDIRYSCELVRSMSPPGIAPRFCAFILLLKTIQPTLVLAVAGSYGNARLVTGLCPVQTDRKSVV